jgi:hypothetical protein
LGHDDIGIDEDEREPRSRTTDAAGSQMKKPKKAAAQKAPQTDAEALLELRIPLSQDADKRMKIRLGKALPDVKSSHRVEALARGLGFQTNAAMREAIRAGEVFVLADGGPFLSYLRERGFHVDVMHFHRAVASVAVERVMSMETRLCLWGYGIGRLQRRDDGRRETACEHHARFLAQRKQLFSDGALDGFLLSLALLQRIPATKTIRPGTGSYLPTSAHLLWTGSEQATPFVVDVTMRAEVVRAARC